MRIMKKHAWLRYMFFFLTDLAVFYGAYIIAFLIEFGNAGFVTDASWRTFSVIALTVNGILSLVISPHSGIFHRPYHEEIVRFIGFVLLNAVCVSVILYLFKLGAVYSRVVIILTYTIYYIMSPVFGYIRKCLMLTGTAPTRLLVLTEPSRAAKLLEDIASSGREIYLPVAVSLAGEGPFPEEIAGIPVIGGVENFASYAVEHDIRRVVIDGCSELIDRDTYCYLKRSGVSVHLTAESMTGFEAEQRGIDTAGIVKTTRLEELSFSFRQRSYRVIKRLLDIVLGGIGCLFLLPAIGLIKLAYLIDHDPSPILYSHTRIGKDGKPFELYKFRSMCPNADEMLRSMLKEEQYRKEWESNQKFNDDPRITTVGLFLRRTSLDELPQLFNVLKGEMSLIGPRPLLPGELEQHGGSALYQKIKPGLTGWWACNGRSHVDYRERLELEYYYIRHCSLYLDLVCLLRTVYVVFTHKGAV